MINWLRRFLKTNSLIIKKFYMEHKHSFDYRTVGSLHELGVEDRELVEAARRACATAHAPYSGFRVGAAARLASGRVVTGSNQESEVFPAGVCAERCLLYAHQAHSPGDHIVAIAVASDPDGRECYPCGICRQVLADTQKRQKSPIRVIMSSRDSATVVDSATLLLPFTFEL
jgi:cytidine deaminase